MSDSELTQRIREWCTKKARRTPAALSETIPMMQQAADRIESLQAELAALRAGGCARDQGLTQWCAEAVAMQAERDKYRDTLLSRHGGECLALLSELDEARAELAACRRENERLREALVEIGVGPATNATFPLKSIAHAALAATAHPAGGDK